MPGARDLLLALKERGHPLVLASSAWVFEAAKRAGMPAIVVRSGGFGDDETERGRRHRHFATLSATSRRLWTVPHRG